MCRAITPSTSSVRWWGCRQAAPEGRSLGIGRSLLGVACEALRSRGLHPALDVVDTNAAAIALYERADWTRVASEPWPHPPAGRRLLYFVAPRPAGSASSAAPSPNP